MNKQLSLWIYMNKIINLNKLWLWEWNPELDKLEWLKNTILPILHTLSSIYSLAFALNDLQKGIMQKSKRKCFLEHNNFEFVQQDWANTRTRRLWKLQKEKKRAAIRLYWKDRTPDEIPGPGSYKEKSHIVEGSHVQFEY